MVAAYSTIITPIDFSITTPVVVSKAVEVANNDGAEIFLLHVLPQSCRQQDDLVAEKMKQLKACANDAVCHDEIRISCVILFSDNIQASIERYVMDMSADLVVLGKASTHWLPFFSSVSASGIVVATGCPVLSVKPGAANARLKTVVVPIGETVPYEKMKAVAALCRNQKLKVHLVTFMNGSNGADNYSASSLLQAYQWLKNSIRCHIEYAVLEGSHKMRSLLNYANSIDADLLLLHPGAEATTGWLKRPLPEVLPASSKLQVMAVQPQNF